MARGLLLVSLVALAACGGDDARGPARDAGLPPGDAGTTGIAEPAPPAPPVLTPCAEGFSEVVDGDGITRCQPPEVSTTCPAGTVQLPGDPTCGPIGAPCPAGDFPDTPPDAPQVLYVRAGASGGDGSRSRPFSSVRTAMTRAMPGGVVLVARGTYAEPLDVYADVTVTGVCAAETIFAPVLGDPSLPAALLQEPRGALRDLTVAPEGGHGIQARADDVRLENVIVEGADAVAVWVARGSLAASRLWAHHTEDSLAMGAGRGLEANDGASLTVDHALVEHNVGSALLAGSAGTTVTVTSSVLRENESESGTPRAISIQDGPMVTLTGVVLERNYGANIFVIGTGATVHADGIVVRDGIPRPTDTGGSYGIVATEGGRAEVRRSYIADTQVNAVGTVMGGTALVEDVIAERVGAAATRDIGIALATAQGGHLEARRVRLLDSGSGGALALGAGTTLDLEDILIRGTGLDGRGAWALGAGDGVTGAMRRVRVETSAGVAMQLAGAGTDFTIEDLAVIDVDGRIDGTLGRAIEMQDQARLRLLRARIERSREVAVAATGSASLEIEDLVLTDARERACAETTCADEPGGSGIGAYGAAVRVTRFALAGARLCGVQIAGGGEIDLAEGEIAGAAVGACVQVSGFDLARITTGVIYRDNGIAVDSAEHAIPEPATPLPMF